MLPRLGEAYRAEPDPGVRSLLVEAIGNSDRPCPGPPWRSPPGPRPRGLEGGPRRARDAGLAGVPAYPGVHAGWPRSLGQEGATATTSGTGSRGDRGRAREDRRMRASIRSNLATGGGCPSAASPWKHPQSAHADLPVVWRGRVRQWPVSQMRRRSPRSRGRLHRLVDGGYGFPRASAGRGRRMPRLRLLGRDEHGRRLLVSPRVGASIRPIRSRPRRPTPRFRTSRCPPRGIDCPNCGRAIEVHDVDAGKSVVCPRGTILSGRMKKRETRPWWFQRLLKGT